MNTDIYSYSYTMWFTLHPNERVTDQGSYSNELSLLYACFKHFKWSTESTVDQLIENTSLMYLGSQEQYYVPSVIHRWLQWLLHKDGDHWSVIFKPAEDLTKRCHLDFKLQVCYKLNLWSPEYIKISVGRAKKNYQFYKSRSRLSVRISELCRLPNAITVLLLDHRPIARETKDICRTMLDISILYNV